MSLSLGNYLCKNEKCLITLDKVKRTEKFIQMSDKYCYRTSAIKQFIKLKLREFFIGDDNFRLPSSNRIQQSDLDLLSINGAERQRIIDEWHATPEYQAIHAENERIDREMAQDMGDESDESAQESYGDESDDESVAESVTESIASTIDHIRNNPEINTAVRWGIHLSHREETEIPLAIIHRIDRFLMQPGHVPSEELEEDEIIQRGRKRPLGDNEYEFLYSGEMPPVGTPLHIHVMNSPNVFDDLETYVRYMNANEPHEPITIENVTGTPITGGRKKTKRKRKTKHGGRSRKSRRKASRRR